MSLFRMYGRIVQVYHYMSEYTEMVPEVDKDGNFSEVERSVTGYYVTREEAESTNGTVSLIDSSDVNWMDGIEVDDVEDTYAEAMRIYNMGKEAYEAEINKPTVDEEVFELKSRVDYMDMMLDLT